jgi:hypothetical protein
MERNRLRQIHDVTDNFFFWQGLRWIPMGAALLGCAAAYTQRLSLPHPVRQWISLPMFAVALWLSTSVLDRYYARRFGRVRGDPSRHRRRTFIKWAIAYPAIAVAFFIDARIAPPMLASALAFAVAIEAYRQSTGGGRVHYIVAALALLVFAMLPQFGVLDPGRASFAPLIGLVGVVYVIGGLLDHAELVRILGNDGQSDVSAV